MSLIQQGNTISTPPVAYNEPVYSYAPGSVEREELKESLQHLASQSIEIPLIIGGKEIRTGNLVEMRSPHDHNLVLGKYHKGTAEHIHMAIKAAHDAWQDWSVMPWEERASIILKAAELLSGPWRSTLNAATMLGQSKTCYQAEIDAACELIDFWRFNVEYLHNIYSDQPESANGIWNWLEYRPLEGFVFAVTPFNFTAIAGNLPTSPALVGNTVLWKPASSSVYSNYFVMKILQEAGLPDGVINMVPGTGSEIGDTVLSHPDFAGVHFTGSTNVFERMWKMIGANIEKYKTYPRIVGETGGKDFIFAHPVCDIDALVAATVRGGFEFQGQKCSAASRVYIPKSIWNTYKEQLLESVKQIKVGDVRDFSNFMGAVIDRHAFENIKGYIDYAGNSNDATILSGGTYDDSKGFFIQPTVIQAHQPKFKTMEEEIFGPVVTIYVYEDHQMDEILKVVDQTSIYALTGAIFAKNRKDSIHLASALRHSAGNFYLNDKPTGAVVGQQPFGGSRKSGTNDKAGSAMNLQRWMSVRTVKETFVPARDFKYPFMKES